MVALLGRFHCEVIGADDGNAVAFLGRVPSKLDSGGVKFMVVCWQTEITCAPTGIVVSHARKIDFFAGIALTI